MSRKRMFFSSGKAAGELGYRWRPPLEAFEDALRWFRERGRLPSRRLPSPRIPAMARRPSTVCQISNMGVPTAMSRALFKSDIASPNSAPTPNKGAMTA